jgi:hypothetical protein
MEEVQYGLFRKQRQGNVNRHGGVRLGQACMDSSHGSRDIKGQDREAGNSGGAERS